MPKRIKTNYPGVYYREADRIGGPGKERVYYIRFKLDGKVIEEKAGRQFQDDMTPARAAGMRSERVEGRRPSRSDLRKKREQAQKEKKKVWTVERIWDLYKEMKQSNTKALRNDEYRYSKHIAPEFAKKQPQEIEPVDLDRWRIKLEKKGLSAATVHACMALLRRLYRFARKRNLCPVPPFHGDFPEVHNVKDDSLDGEQLARLLKVLDAKHEEGGHNRKVASMLRLALFTGMRRGEIFNLKWEDVDFQRGFIRIRNPKGGKDTEIPLMAEAQRIVAEQPSREHSEYVFPNRNGDKLDNVARTVRTIRKDAKLPDSFRPFHGLRHTFASVLASSGRVDLYTISKLLTHRSTVPTMRYAHLIDEALKRGATVAESALLGANAAEVVEAEEEENREAN